jgi:hypothetical protein
MKNSILGKMACTKNINKIIAFEMLKNNKRINSIKLRATKVNYFHNALYGIYGTKGNELNVTKWLAEYLDIGYSASDIVSLSAALMFLKSKVDIYSKNPIPLECFLLRKEISEKLYEDMLLDIKSKNRTLYISHRDDECLFHKYHLLKHLFGKEKIKAYIKTNIDVRFKSWRESSTNNNSDKAMDEYEKKEIALHSNALNKIKYTDGLKDYYVQDSNIDNSQWIENLNSKIEDSVNDAPRGIFGNKVVRPTTDLMLTYQSMETKGSINVYKNIMVLDAKTLRVITVYSEFKTNLKLDAVIQKEINKTTFSVDKKIKVQSNIFLFSISNIENIDIVNEIIEKVNNDHRTNYGKITLEKTFDKKEIKISLVGMQTECSEYVRNWESILPPRYAKELLKYLGKATFLEKTDMFLRVDRYVFNVKLKSLKKLKEIEKNYSPLSNFERGKTYIANENVVIGHDEISKGTLFEVTKVGRDYKNKTEAVLKGGSVKRNIRGFGNQNEEKWTNEDSINDIVIKYDPYDGILPNCNLVL